MCLFFAFVGKLPPQQAPHFPTNEDLRHLKRISDPVPSPDGRQVLFVITESTADGASSHLWLADVASNTSRQLTYSPPNVKTGESDGRWMPDGKSILFLASRGEHRQLFELPMSGGEAHSFTVKVTPQVDTSKKQASAADKPAPIEADVQSFSISPNGKSIALIVGDPQTEGEQAETTKKSDAVWVDHDPHGSRLYLFDPETSKVTAVPVPANVTAATWSHDGSRLFVTQGPLDGSDDLDFSTTSWLVDASSIKAERIGDLPRSLFTAEWSADDKSIWFTAQTRKDAPPLYADLYRYDLASKSIKTAVQDFEGSVGFSLSSLRNGDLLVDVGLGFRQCAIRVSGEKRQMVTFSAPFSGAFATNAQQNAWVYIGSGSTQPSTLYYTSDISQPAHVLKTPPLIPEGLQAVPTKTLHWKSDKFTIEGVLQLPPEAAQHKVPLIVEVHGGPTGAFFDSYSAYCSFLVGQGWAVLRVNPRGSTNYGVEFVAANKNDLGGGDYRDIMTGVDYVLKNEPIDENKMALEGYSYGGEMAGFVEVKTKRFKAIVCGAPVIDQFSEYGTESIGSFYDRWFYGKPWEHFADAWRQSPLSGAAHASTPFMLLQGQGDTTDPQGQSQEMYRALRQAGAPVQLITYPRDDHGQLAGAIYGAPSREPWHGFDARQRVVEFFKKAFGETK
ncbi:MAG TPA: prolyl oligopeptidase family serine peptidase [Fimbriimonas sp.]|nr:prolyl oligopeptidase family serine peptidase [Fimbriimonas sp.]